MSKTITPTPHFVATIQDVWHYTLAASPTMTHDSTFAGQNAKGRPGVKYTVKVGLGFARKVKNLMKEVDLSVPALPTTHDGLEAWTHSVLADMRTRCAALSVDPRSGRRYQDEALKEGYCRTFDDGDWEVRDATGALIDDGWVGSRGDVDAQNARKAKAMARLS